MYFSSAPTNADEVLRYAVAELTDEKDGFGLRKTRRVIRPDVVGCMHSDCSSNHWRYARMSGGRSIDYESRFSVEPATTVFVSLDAYYKPNVNGTGKQAPEDHVIALCKRHAGTLKGLIKRAPRNYGMYRLAAGVSPDLMLEDDGLRGIAAKARNEWAYEKRKEQQARDLYILEGAPARLWDALSKQAQPESPPWYNLRVDVETDMFGVSQVRIGGRALPEGQVRALIEQLSTLVESVRKDNMAALGKARRAALEAGFVAPGE